MAPRTGVVDTARNVLGEVLAFRARTQNTSPNSGSPADATAAQNAQAATIVTIRSIWPASPPEFEQQDFATY